MDFEHLQTVLFEAIENSKTQLEGLTIFDKFTVEEVGDIVTDIATLLPKYPDLLVQEVKQRVLQVFEEEDLIIYLDKQIKDLFRLKLANKITREQDCLLVFYLMFSYKTKYTENSLTIDLQDIRGYFMSYIIHTSTELVREIEDVPLAGKTKIVGNYYVRVSSDFKLIPTTTTIEQFINYLSPI